MAKSDTFFIIFKGLTDEKRMSQTVEEGLKK